jgi:hypothetical protein
MKKGGYSPMTAGIISARHFCELSSRLEPGRIRTVKSHFFGAFLALFWCDFQH